LIGHFSRVVGGREKSVIGVLDEIGQSADTGRQDTEAAGHGFEHRDRSVINACCVQKNIVIAQVKRDPGFGNSLSQLDSSFKRRGHGTGFDFGEASVAPVGSHHLQLRLKAL
jgi:hypothetical protein